MGARLLLVFAVIAGAFICKPVARAQAPTPGFSLIWNRPVADLSALSLSPQGQRIAMLTNNGKLAVWSSNGAPIWSRDKETARAVVISDGAGSVVAYDPLDPLDPTLTIVSGNNGTKIAKLRLDSATWAATVSRDGLHAAVSTDKHSIYYYTLGPQLKAQRWQAGGICDSLAFAPNNDFLIAGLWNASGVECFGMDGKEIWNDPGPSDRRYAISITPESRFVVALAYANHKDSDGQVMLFNASDGRSLWSYSLGKSTYYCDALAGDDAQTTVASFARFVRHRDTFTEARRLVAIDRLGNKMWDKGGLFLSPTLICMAPASEGVVVYDQARTLYLLDSDGHEVNRARLSGFLRLWAVSADNRELLVYTGDGQLSLYKLG